MFLSQLLTAQVMGQVNLTHATRVKQGAGLIATEHCTCWKRH